MNPCTAIVYNQTDNNMAVGSLRAAEKAAHDGPDGLFAITDATGNLVESLSDGLLDQKRNQIYNVFIPDDREAPAGTSQQFFETTGFPMPWR